MTDEEGVQTDGAAEFHRQAQEQSKADQKAAAKSERDGGAVNDGVFNVVGRLSASRIEGDGGGMTEEQRRLLEKQEGA